MRAPFAIAILALGIAGLNEAGAADLRTGRSVNVTHYSTVGVRAAPLVIYDNEPGVYVRAYWATPWRNRHYYPFTGKKPKVGRRENLSAKRAAPKPAETFYREWSTIALFPPTRRYVRELPADIAPAPSAEPLVQPFGPLK